VNPFFALPQGLTALRESVCERRADSWEDEHDFLRIAARAVYGRFTEYIGRLNSLERR
jgi:hypothetical protein